MSTDYFVVCYTCKVTGPNIASGSIAYGFKVWGDGLNEFRDWLVGESIRPGVSKEGVGAHEGHDVRIVSEKVDLPWECCGIPFEDGKCPICSDRQGWLEGGGDGG